MPISEAIPQRIRYLSEMVWLAIALLTPLFVNLWAEQQFEASKIWLVRTLIWVLALLWLAGRLYGIGQRALPARIQTLTVALTATLTVATAASDFHFVAIFGSLERGHGVLTQLSYLLLFVCVASLITRRGSETLLRLIIFTTLPIGLFGLAQAAGWNPLPSFSDARSPLITTLGRANFTGAYLALTLPLTVAAFVRGSSRRERFWYGLLIVLEIVVLCLAQARAAWISGIVGLGLFFWLLCSHRWTELSRQAFKGSAALLAVGAAGLIVRQGQTGGGSIAARWTIWEAALKLLWQRLWLGYGADTLELYFPAVYPPELVYYQGRGIIVDRAHNWLFDWSLSYGIVATGILIALCWFVLRAGRYQLEKRSASDGSDSLPAAWLAAALSAVVAHLVGNLFLFDVVATATMFWLLLAVIVAASKESLPRPVQPARSRRALLVGATMLCLAAVWSWNLRPMMADIYSWQGSRALNLGQTEVALQAYRTAAALQPERAAYHVATALTSARLGDMGQAEQAMGQAIQLRPTDPTLYGYLAALYESDSERAQTPPFRAYKALDRAILLAPTVAVTYEQYADIAYRHGDLERARNQAEAALNLDETAGLAHGLLGWTLLEQNDPENAIPAFENAVTWEPRSANFYLGLAIAALQTGEIDQARQAVQRSLMLDPHYSPALDLQHRLALE